MKNQHQKGNGHSSSNGSFTNDHSNGNSMYRNQDSSYGKSRGPNSGYEDQNRSSDFGSRGRRGDNNYGYGSDNNETRDDHGRFASQQSSNGRVSSESQNNSEDYSWGENSRSGKSWSPGSERSGDVEPVESHRGKGPKGFKRSDDRLKEDISQKLSDDHDLDASEIEVAVENGEVTLTGTVLSRYDKRNAEDLAESVSGVSHLENRLRVSKVTSKNSKSTSADDSDEDSGKEKTKTPKNIAHMHHN